MSDKNTIEVGAKYFHDVCEIYKKSVHDKQCLKISCPLYVVMLILFKNFTDVLITRIRLIKID